MTIGNDALPGIITDVESIPTVTLSGISNANVAIVGDGNPSEGSATTNEPYTITRPTAVSELFGPNSQLSRNVRDALSEGAMPVYAVMADHIETTKSLDSLGGATGTFQDAPISEDVDSITIDVNGTTYDVVKTFEQPQESDVGTDEALVNPLSGDFALDVTPTSGTATYQSLDYSGALDALQTEEAENIDAIGALSEVQSVSDLVETTVNEMESFHQFAVGIVGAGAVIDTSSVTNMYDNSRMGVMYPSRNNEWESTIGSVLGMIGNLGLDGSIMNKRMSGHRRLSERLTRSQQTSLVEENIIPIASETQGAKVIDDITSVADDNAEEAKMDTVFNRLVIDHITREIKAEEEPFIGRLNKPAVRGALQALITAELQFLLDQEAILDYEVEVSKRDADSCFVDVSVETVEPLRNIYNTIAAGRIE